MVGEICLDANIFVAALADEPAREICQSLLQRLEEKDVLFFEPALIVFEVASAMRKKTVLNQLTPVEANKALDIFFQKTLLLQWQSYLLARAAVFSQKMDLKNAYDASYLAVAEGRNIPFVTLDEAFQRKAKTVYKRVYSVEEFLKKTAPV